MSDTNSPQSSPTASDIEKKLTPRPRKSRVALPGLSTGSTLLNLACTGRPDEGFLPGNYYYLVGDSSSGKSFLSLTCLAEAANHPTFQDYRFIFDNAENGALMNIRKFFGKRVAEKLEPPKGTITKPEYSRTVEDFYYNVDDAFESGTPFLYILDSMDALSSLDEEENFEESKKAREKDKKAPGSFGTSKARVNSSHLRILFNRLRKEGRSILLVISQTRQNIGYGAMFNPKTRGGGQALTFYAAMEIWTSVKGHVKTKAKGRDVEQGIYCSARTKKNRLSGKDRVVEFPILHSSGIDDVGGCIDFLIHWGHWKSTKGVLTAPEFGFTGDYEDLVQKVQNESLESELQRVTGRVWNEIEAESELKRKPRYG